MLTGDTALVSSLSLIRLAMVKDFFLGLSWSVKTGAGGDEDTGDGSPDDGLVWDEGGDHSGGVDIA